MEELNLQEIINKIKLQTGVELKLCPNFPGIRLHNGKKYFNALLSERLSESKDYDILKRFADKYKTISVEPNGLDRIAIYLNK